MYFYRIFVLLTLSLLIPLNVECGKKDSKKGSNPATLTGSSVAPANTSSQESPESQSQSQPQATVTENPLDLDDLKQEYGIIKENTIDRWNFKFYKSYINQNFNKLKKASLDLWPDTVSEACVFEFMLVSKDNKHFLCLKSINPEGTTGVRHFYFEYDSSNPSNSKKEDLQTQDFLKKLKGQLNTVLVEPFPADMVKDPLFQKLHYDRTAGPDESSPNHVKVI